MAIIIWMKVIKLLYLFLGSQILHVCFTICLLYFRDFTTTKTRMKNLFGLRGSLNLEEYNGMTVLFSSEIAMWTC